MGKFGRPTTYTDDVLYGSLEYLRMFTEEGYERPVPQKNEVIPTVVGLCRYIKRSRSIVYDWIKHEDKADFSDIISAIEDTQHIDLVNGGITGAFNPMISKLMLSKHGYTEKSEVDNKSSDGSMSPNTYSQEDYKNAQDKMKSDMEDLD